ncbi:hypothetical protein Leryth_010453, partial [Lithospermum erythrorhizon]
MLEFLLLHIDALLKATMSNCFSVMLFNVIPLQLAFMKMMATNYIGAFCLTSILLPLLEASPVASRVVNVSSFTHRSVSSMIVDRGAVISGNHAFTSECYPCARIYEYTKLCVLLFTYELHRQFGLSETSRAISVIAVDPGAVKTNIMREIPSLVSQIAFFGLNLLGLLHHPEQGVRPIVDAALASSVS